MLTYPKRFLGIVHRFFRSLKQHTIGLSKFCNAASSKKPEEENNSSFEKFRFKYTEFLPNPDVKKRNPVREKLERRDMLRRRNVIPIPEFYVGSIIAVTTSDKHAASKETRFVGICIYKNYKGLQSSFILRNVIEHQGVEIRYFLYSPIIRKIELLKLEKRLDEELFYLRDAPLEYSTFPFDMPAQYHADEKEVPVNPIQVKINPRPWLQRYERMDLKGVILPELPQRFYDKAKAVAKPWEKYDLVDEYRRSIPEKDQKDVFKEICEELFQLEKKQKIERKKKVFLKPERKGLF